MRLALCVIVLVHVAHAQPYGELLETLMQDQPTERFDQFCRAWIDATWVQNVTTTTIESKFYKTCDGLYQKAADTPGAAPRLLLARPMTGPDRPPGVFSNVATAASSKDAETIISVCSQVATSVTEGTPEIGQCPETHPFPNGDVCCPQQQSAGGDTSACLRCTSLACTEPRHCPSGTVDGDLTIKTQLQQWYPENFGNLVLMARLYNPGAGFDANNLKVGLVPNLELGTGTRAFYEAMSDPERLHRLCFSQKAEFEAVRGPPSPPPWTLALTFLGAPVPGQPMQRAVGPNVTMVNDGAQVVGPDNHVVISSASVAFAWVLGASAALKKDPSIDCTLTQAPTPSASQQQAVIDAANVRQDTHQHAVNTRHAWQLVNETVRVGLPFASDSACLDVVDGVPSLNDMQMLCDVSAPDCVAVAIKPGRACLVVASQTADGVALPYRLDDQIDHPPDSVFTQYAVREAVAGNLALIDGVAALGFDRVTSTPGHTVQSCQSLCWGDANCTAWTVTGTDCAIVGPEEAKPVITTDNVNLTCLPPLGFDIQRSGQCAGLPLDYAFSTRHNKCVHLQDYLMQPWCPQYWTTASTAADDNDIQDPPELSSTGASYASYPRATCMCADNPVATAVEHRVGASSADGVTNVRCTGTGSKLRHPGAYSQANYSAFRMFVEDAATVRELERFDCAVAETCPDEAAARCEVVANCSGAIVDGATASVRIIAGVVFTSANTVESGPPTLESRRKSTILSSEMPNRQTAGDTIFMTKFGYGLKDSTVQVGTRCEVEYMHFVPLNLVCVGVPGPTWQPQQDHRESIYGAVDCEPGSLGDRITDNNNFECVDRPVLGKRPPGAQDETGMELLPGQYNVDFVGAVPVAHKEDKEALFPTLVEQCVNPGYTMGVGPVVRRSCTAVRVGGNEPRATIQSQFATMQREVMQVAGCLETDGIVPSSVGSSMSDLFQYAYKACLRAKTMYAQSTLGDFLDDGGKPKDVLHATGCNSTAESLSASSFTGSDLKMTDIFDIAHDICTSPEEINRIKCCGTKDCVPVRCKKLTGVLPLPRCSVTAPRCALLTAWERVPDTGPVDTSGSAAPCTDVGRGAVALDGAYAGLYDGLPDAGCNLQNPFRRSFGDELAACYSVRIDDLATMDCTQLAEAFNIKAGFSYGFATPAAQKRWQSIPCVGLLPFPANPGTTCACACSTCAQDRNQPLCDDAHPCPVEQLPDAGCNAQNPFRRAFGDELAACYSVKIDDLETMDCTQLAQAFNIKAGFSFGFATPAAQKRWQTIPCVGLLPFPANPGTTCACACSGCARDRDQPLCANAKSCTEDTPLLPSAAMMPSRLPDLQIAYPAATSRQIVPAAPASYRCASKDAPTAQVLDNGNILITDSASVFVRNQALSRSAWHAAGCFSESGRLEVTTGVASLDLNAAQLVGNYSAACQGAQQGQANDEIACCGRVGCGSVLACPVVPPFVFPLKLCSDNRLAHRSGTGYRCLGFDLTSGVACKHRCALADSKQECRDVVAVDVGGDGCALVPSAACPEVKPWDDVEAFPCAAGVDTKGNACQGDSLQNNTCKVRQQQSAAPSPCPKFGDVDVLHAPYNYDQLPGSCQSNVFGGDGIQPATFHETWAQCERQADLAGASEFSYDESTGRCVVNTGATPCNTVDDVRTKVAEMNHFGSARPTQGTGTDLRAWIGVDGAREVFANDNLTPATDKALKKFVCMPKLPCLTRDLHGRCVSTKNKNAVDNCGDVPKPFYATGCKCNGGQLPDSLCLGFCNCQQCNRDGTTCDSGLNIETGFVDAFLDDQRTLCNTKTQAECVLDSTCQMVLMSDLKCSPRIDELNGVHVGNPCGVSSTGAACPSDKCDDATAQYVGNRLDDTQDTMTTWQKEFHDQYHLRQESLLGQDYASSFYRAWLAHPWNREKYMAAAARHNAAEGDLPFYASAIWSGAGGATWRELPRYDRRWMPGAATVGMMDLVQSGLDGAGVDRQDPLPNAAKSDGGFWASYVDASTRATPMWSPVRAWLLGAWDPFLDTESKYMDVVPRSALIKQDFRDRIVAFRGSQPLETNGAKLHSVEQVPRANAANDCMQKCVDLGDACHAVSLQSALLESDTEPLDFVRTGGGLGAQGSQFYRPQACEANHQPHLSSFQYNVMRYCPFSWLTELKKGIQKVQTCANFGGGRRRRVGVGNDCDATKCSLKGIPTNQNDPPGCFGVSTLWRLRDDAQHAQYTGGLDSSTSHHAMEIPAEFASTHDIYDATGGETPYFPITDFAGNEVESKEAYSESVPTYGADWVFGMMGSIGPECSKHTSGPFVQASTMSSYTTVGSAQCHLKVGLHHCDYCWNSGMSNFDTKGKPSRAPRTAPKLTCKLWKKAPLESLGPDPEGSTVTASDGDDNQGLQKTIDLNNHNGDNPIDDPMAYAKARMQRPTPVRFRYTTIYLPEAGTFQQPSNTDASTATRYRRKSKPPIHRVHKNRVNTNAKAADDDKVATVRDTQVDASVRMTTDALQQLGVASPDYWVGRDTACNFNQGERPVFTSVKCPANKPMTCALPWTVAAQNVVDTTSNANNPTDYRKDSGTTKCQPVVAVCLAAEMRYIGVLGSSLCAELVRVLEVVTGGESGSTLVQSVDLGPPPHAANGNFSWPVAWLQRSANESSTADATSFRTRRAEPRPTSNLGACPDRKPCTNMPCPTGMGLSWTQAGTAFCTRVGAGSRGYQQVTRDVPKSVHSGKSAFGGFVQRNGAVSGTGPALYANASACSSNGCGGDIMSACRFDHQVDRKFPSCQARAAQACCDADVRLRQAFMPDAELILLQPPNNLVPVHVDHGNVTCEAPFGVACGNGEFASRTVHDSTCRCDSASCQQSVQQDVRAATMPSLDAAAVVVSQGKRCGTRFEWATQYASFGQGSARCNGVDDLFAGGGPLATDGHQRCGCKRSPPDDPRWPRTCTSPSGCAMHGMFNVNGNSNGASCAGDVRISVPPGAAQIKTQVFGGDASNMCAHQCLHHGAPCWAFDVTGSLACVLHVDRSSSAQCNGQPRFVRAMPSWSVTVPQHGAPRDRVDVDNPTASTAAECPDQCAATLGCRSWAFDAANNQCVLAAAVRTYQLSPRNNATEFPLPVEVDPFAKLAENRTRQVGQALGNISALNITQRIQLFEVKFNELFGNTTTNITVNVSQATEEDPVVIFNRTLFAPCSTVLGTVGAARIVTDCEQACDDGATLGCTGFEINKDGACTLCAGSGGTFQVVPSPGDVVGDYHGIDTGVSSVAHESLDDCKAACDQMDRTGRACGHCVAVHSVDGEQAPRYVQAPKTSTVSNMPVRNVYPWVQPGDAFSKWDANCCSDAPCGQTQAPSDFLMSACPGPPADADQAGPNAMSDLDVQTMTCFTRCRAKFANPPACDQCAQDNFDPATGCTQCLAAFALASDGTCSLCRDPRRDVAGTPPCQDCIPGFRLSDSGECQEWTCDAKLKFDAQVPSVTETSDVVLELGTGRRLATGAFVGVANGRVPASLRSTLVRHRGNVYLLGNNARFLVVPEAVAGIDGVVHDALAVGSDWLDSLPMADSTKFQQPLNQSVLMAPGAGGVLGHHRCGAPSIEVITSLSASVQTKTAKEACKSVAGNVPLCTTADAATPQACALACVQNTQCVAYVHQTGSRPTYTQEHTRFENSFDVFTETTCELYDAQQAANHQRPRNIMVEDGRCSGAGVRVPGEGLQSYAATTSTAQMAPVEPDLQFRVVRALDLLGQAAGCWLLTRWHRHRIDEVDALNVTGQSPCLNNSSSDVVTVEYLEHHAPLQGDDVRGDVLVGFMPRARTTYKFVAGGVQVSNSSFSMAQCVQLCAHGFATEWHAETHACLCFADDSAARIELVADTFDEPNVMISGRRPVGGRVLQPGPVPAACTVQAAVVGAQNVAQCDAATSKADGFALGPDGCRPLVDCNVNDTSPLGDIPSADVVQLHRHPVLRPVRHDTLAFGELDVPVVDSTLALDAAACCANCNTSSANSYRFDRATGTCECFDARAKVCAPSLELVKIDACRFCTEQGQDDALCTLGLPQDCVNQTRTVGAPPCNQDTSFVTYSGAGVSHGCTGGLENKAASSTKGCDRSSGCVLVKKSNEIEKYFCAQTSVVNTDTREWNKPPRAVQTGETDGKAADIPSKAGFCLAHGYAGGACPATSVIENRHRIASCECALDATGNVVSACDNVACVAPAQATAVWCCDAPNATAPCGPTATASAVVADITTVFTPHNARTAIATLHHDNVCSASAGLAQTFSMVRCAPNECLDMGLLVQNALFVVSSQDPSKLIRVPNDDCSTCNLCNFPTQYRSGLDIKQLNLATGASDVDPQCPAHMPHPVATQCITNINPVTEACRLDANPGATPNACALTTWGGAPLCCRPGQACLDDDGKDMRLPECKVMAQLNCTQLREPCPYQAPILNTACQALASVVLRNVASTHQCRDMCNIGDSSAPCLLYEYEPSTQLCLLGKADSPGMRACATRKDSRQVAPGVELVIKKPPPSAVCDSAQLRHFAQPTHVAKHAITGTQPVVLSTVAAEHAALYGTPAATKVKRLYGTFTRSYDFARKTENWLPPFDTLCNTNGTHCPGTRPTVFGHLVAHPGLGDVPESMVFQSTVGTASTSDNAAVVTSAAVMTSPAQAGSDACITQAELSVQGTATLGAVSERLEHAVGKGWIDGVNAVSLSQNVTQAQCLQACISRSPPCVLFQHNSLDPLQLAQCQLYVGRRLAVDSLVDQSAAQSSSISSTVYVTSGVESCTSPEQCVHVSKAQTVTELQAQAQAFQNALQRCQQETFDLDTGRPKLIGRATYVNVIQCPKDGPRPVPAHLEFYDHGAGVMCWSDRVAAPGKRSLSANQASFYPFSAPQPSEAQDEQDAPPVPSPLDFRVDDGVFEDVSTDLIEVGNCKFQSFRNTSAIVDQNAGPSFQNLRSVLNCNDDQTRNANKDQCEVDDACVFVDATPTQPTPTCSYACTRERCANTLLCRGFVETATQVTCLFLRAGVEPGTMQPPSALQPCLVTGLHKLLVASANVTTFLKTDCCLKKGSI